MNSGDYEIPVIFLMLIVIILIDMRSIKTVGKISGLNLKDPEAQKKYNCKKAEKIQYILDFVAIIGILAMMSLDLIFQWTRSSPVAGCTILLCLILMVFLPIAKSVSRLDGNS